MSFYTYIYIFVCISTLPRRMCPVSSPSAVPVLVANGSGWAQPWGGVATRNQLKDRPGLEALLGKRNQWLHVTHRGAALIAQCRQSQGFPWHFKAGVVKGLLPSLGPLMYPQDWTHCAVQVWLSRAWKLFVVTATPGNPPGYNSSAAELLIREFFGTDYYIAVLLSLMTLKYQICPVCKLCCTNQFICTWSPHSHILAKWMQTACTFYLKCCSSTLELSWINPELPQENLRGVFKSCV